MNEKLNFTQDKYRGNIWAGRMKCLNGNYTFELYLIDGGYEVDMYTIEHSCRIEGTWVEGTLKDAMLTAEDLLSEREEKDRVK